MWTVLLFFGAGVAKQMPKTICPRNKIPHRMNLQVKQNTQGPRNEIHHGPTVDPDASVQIPKTRYYIIFLARRGGGTDRLMNLRVANTLILFFGCPAPGKPTERLI